MTRHQNRHACRPLLLLAMLGLTTSRALADGPRYTITDLGPIAPQVPFAWSESHAVNELGQVVGRGTNAADLVEPTLWLAEPAHGLPAGPNGLGGAGTALAINDSGHVVGAIKDASGELMAYRWDPASGVTMLGSLGGVRSLARGINDAGLVVGESDPGSAGSTTFKAAVLWDGTQMIDLGAFEQGVFQSRAEDINELGQVVGFSTYLGPASDPDGPIRPFLWLPEPAYGLPAGLNDIDPLNADPAAISTARAVNDLGQVVCWGSNQLPNGSYYPSFALWLPEPAYGLPAGMNDLRGPWGGASTAFAQDVNDRGEIVFRANVDPSNPFGDWRAMLWIQGQWYDLHQRIFPIVDRFHWSLGSATAINDAGQICGWGYYQGDWRGFLLTPVIEEPACAGDIDGDGAVAVTDMLALLAGWGLCPGSPGAQCTGDLDGNGVVDVTDLVTLLGGWGPCSEAPLGACCFEITGDCTETTDAECAFLGGTWVAGGSCDAGVCPPVALGACCLYPSGACIEATEFECDYVHGGTFNGPGLDCTMVSCPVPAPGDRIADPFLVDAFPFSATGTTAGFGDDYDETCDAWAIAPDVVYAWTPAQDADVRISLCANTAYDSKLYVYENAEGNVVACNDDACTTPSFPGDAWVSEIDVLTVSAGTTYYVIVDGYGTESGPYTLDITPVDLGACCLPDGSCQQTTVESCGPLGGLWQGPGTDCATVTCPPFPVGACCVGSSCIAQLTEWDCTQLFGGSWYGADTLCADVGCSSQPGERVDVPLPIAALPFSTTGDTSTFYDWHDEACPVPSQAPEVVYAYTPGTDQTVTISLCADSAFDTKLYVYENAETPGAPYACNDDACVTPSFPLAAWISELTGLTLTAGNTYYIVVDGFGDEAGVYTLDLFEE